MINYLHKFLILCSKNSNFASQSVYCVIIMKKTFFFICTLLLSASVLADDFEVNGLHFQVRETNSDQVEVTFQHANANNYENLTTIEIPEQVSNKGVPYKVTAVGKAAFAYAKNLQTVVIPVGIVDINPHAFYGCSALKSVKFPKGLKKVDKMAFAYTGVEEVVLPDGLLELGDLAFAYCDDLKRLSLPNSINHFGANSFKNCVALEKIRFADGTQSIGEYAFSGCKSLAKVTLPAGLKHPGKGAFADCENLAEVTLGKDMEDIGADAFEHCDALAQINIPTTSPYFKSTEDGVILSADGKTLLHYPGGKRNSIYSVPANIEAIGPNAFGGNSHLNQVNIPANIKEIGVSAFEGCKNLKLAAMAEGLQVIRNSAFAYCTSLANIVVPKSVVKVEKNAFFKTGDYNNKKNWKSRILYIGDCMVGKADDQQKTGNMVVRPGTRIIAEEAMDSSLIVEVEIPKGVEIIGERAFYNCVRLADITIPATLTSVGRLAFDSTAYFNTDKNWKNGVLYLDKILLRIDPEVEGKIKLKKILLVADEAFANCSDVTEVKLNDATQYIGRRAFLNCTNLQEVNVPKQLLKIGSEAFSGAPNIDRKPFEQVVEENNPNAGTSDLFELY